MSFKSDPPAAPALGEFELYVLLAVLRLGDDAYGVSIRDELERRTARQFTLGAIYKTLGRLEDKRLVAGRDGDPSPVRGGRRKRLYRLAPAGVQAVAQAVEELRQLTRGAARALEAM
jgi:DNA-binding PadR family transcriptional regulator